MSSKAKGRRSENKVKEWYREQGYLVDNVALGGRFTKSKDLFSGLCMTCGEDGCALEGHKRFPGFDLIVMKPGFVEYVQVKTNSPATQAPYKWFASIYTTRNIKVVCATVYDYQGIRFQYYNKCGTIREKDLR